MNQSMLSNWVILNPDASNRQTVIIRHELSTELLGGLFLQHYLYITLGGCTFTPGASSNA